MFSARISHGPCRPALLMIPSAILQCPWFIFFPVHLVKLTHSYPYLQWLGAFHGAMILGRGYGHLEMS